jgi:hypothetical protein
MSYAILPHRVLEPPPVDVTAFPRELVHLLDQAPSRRYLRHARGCVCCAAKAPDVARDHLFTNVRVHTPASREPAISRIIGWAYECADCARAGRCYQLCETCYTTGEHGHPHPLTKSAPPCSSYVASAGPNMRNWYSQTHPRSGSLPWSWSDHIVDNNSYGQDHHCMRQ